MATPGETPPEDSGSFPVAATAGEAQPIPLEGGQEGTQPTLANMMSMLQRLADRVETMSTEQAKMQDVAQATTAATAEIRRLDEYVRQGFSHFDDRVNRSRVVEQQMRDQLRSARTSDMPGLMPSDVKPAKIEKLSTTNIDELRNWFRHARGYLKYHNINPEEPRSVYWASGYFHGPVSKWWYAQVASTHDEIGGGFTGITHMEAALITEFCGRTPAKQARINLDRATQRTTVQKYANYFREQLLELPHRHEEDNVHDFQRGLKPHIRKEVALKNPKTLAEAVQAALAVEAAERETDVHREIRRERLNIMDDDGDDDEQYYSSAEGETTEHEDDLLMARRLTEEEFERFKKEGRCFICRAKGHAASACPSKKKKISEYRPRKTRPGN
eukprot:jgi/Tetstr1/439153/TSEL_027605.t1